MDTLERHSKSAARILALLGFLGLFVLALMTTLDVVLRWLFSSPIQGVNDVSAVVMAVVIASCIPANLAMKQNIRVDILGAVAGNKVHLILDLFASLVTLAFIILIAWQFIPYVISLREAGERTWVLGWPVWPWWACASVLLCLSVLAQMVVTLADFRRLATNQTLAASEPPIPLGVDDAQD